MLGKQRFGARAAVVLVVCGVVGASLGTGSAGAATKPKSGGSIKFLQANPVGQLDPALGSALPGSSVEYPAYLAIFDGLLSPNAVTGQAEPRLAKSFTSKDNLVWTMKLQTGVKFSDGTAFDADAIKVNWDRIQSRTPTVAAKANFAGVASYAATDPSTLTITLKEPSPDFAYLLSTWAQNWIVSPAQIKSNEAQIARSPAGAGAYTVKEFVLNNQIVLTRNPTYHGKTYLDQITIGFVADEAQRLATFQSGAADLLRAGSPTETASAKQAGLEVRPLETAGGAALQFNTARPPFNDVRARRAIQLAFDVDELNKAAFAGAATPVRSIFPKQSPYYGGVNMTKSNDKKAQALFNELAAEGKPVSFTLHTIAATQWTVMGSWLQTKLAGFKNVTMKHEIFGSGSLTNTLLIPGQFDVAAVAQLGVVPSEFAINLQTGGGKNFGKFSDPAMDAALKAASAATSVQARAAAAKDLQIALNDQVPVLMYHRVPSAAVISKKVKGYAFVFFNVPDWTKLWTTAS
jgi:peptide/nickel transport system substrate-binding protein